MTISAIVQNGTATDQRVQVSLDLSGDNLQVIGNPSVNNPRSSVGASPSQSQYRVQQTNPQNWGVGGRIQLGEFASDR